MNRKNLTAAVLAGLLAFSVGTAQADSFLEVGLGVNAYGSISDITDATDLDTALTLDARWGFGPGFYAFGSYEQPDLTFEGTTVGDLRVMGVGAGWRTQSRFYGFAEGGYYFTQRSSSLDAFKLDNQFGGSVGVGFDFTDHITADVSYRYLKFDQNNYFGSSKVDMSAWGLGLAYRF